MPESLADTVGGKIFTFGSYRLGALILKMLADFGNKYRRIVYNFYDPKGFKLFHV